MRIWKQPADLDAVNGWSTRTLMHAIEAQAQTNGRTTLVLDTREGDPSEQLYQSFGFIRVGAIPQYVISEDGSMSATVMYYKLV